MPDGATLSAADVLLSKKELARALGCSLPTVDRLIERYRIPAAREGGPGQAFGYSLADVQRTLGAARARDAEASAQRDELLSGLNLGELGPHGDVDDDALTPAQRAALARAIQIERQNAVTAGELVPAGRLKAVLATALVAFGRSLDALPARLGRQHNLPDALVRQISQEIRGARAQMVRDVQQSLGQAEAATDEQSSLPV